MKAAQRVVEHASHRRSIVGEGSLALGVIKGRADALHRFDTLFNAQFQFRLDHQNFRNVTKNLKRQMAKVSSFVGNRFVFQGLIKTGAPYHREGSPQIIKSPNSISFKLVMHQVWQLGQRENFLKIKYLIKSSLSRAGAVTKNKRIPRD